MITKPIVLGAVCALSLCAGARADDSLEGPTTTLPPTKEQPFQVRVVDFTKQPAAPDRPQSVSSGDCRMSEAKLYLRDDGTASFVGSAYTNGGKDVWHGGFQMTTDGGAPLIWLPIDYKPSPAPGGPVQAVNALFNIQLDGANAIPVREPFSFSPGLYPRIKGVVFHFSC